MKLGDYRCKKTTAWFFCKIHFYPNLGKKGPKIGYFVFLWKFWHLIFLKAMQNKNSFNSSLFIANLMSGKICFLELSKCIISRKNCGIKLIFSLWKKIREAYKVVLSLMVGVVMHVQSSKNNKFAISLKYLKEEWAINMIFCMKINIKVF